MKPKLISSAFILIAIAFTVSCNRGSNLPVNSKTDKDSLCFIVMGDWGKDGNLPQQSVALALDSFSRKFHASFIITTGDNFYPNGVATTKDAHWQASFEKVYNRPGDSVTWYPVLGNHDYETNPQAEIDYQVLDTRWNLPSRYYMVRKSVGSSTALFVFTDTSPFVDAYYSYGHYPDIRQQDTAAQLSWLRQTLNGSTDQWKIVLGHHPVYSSGVHSNTPELIAKFKPVFQQSKTNFYICGHDHSLQSITVGGDQVHYLVSGGGSEHTPVYPDNTSLFSKSSLGFLIVTLYTDKARYYFVNDGDSILYQGQVNR